MVLAGVLLKLGGYGLLRFMAFSRVSLFFMKGVLVRVGLLGGLVSCFLCLRQSDLKAFVAYSSVCHMGFGLGGLFRGCFVGWGGSIFMMVGHGFCSSCLFYVLFVFYERLSSRRIHILKGVGVFMPMVRAVWFLFCILNMGVPPSFSFFSEVMIVRRLVYLNFFCFFFGGLLLLFSGFYAIYLYVICSHGRRVVEGLRLFLRVREFGNFFLHFFFLFFFIIRLDFFFL